MEFIIVNQIDKSRACININDIVAFEEGNYISKFDNDYGFEGRSTRVITKIGSYTVRQSFDDIVDMINMR